MVELRLINDLPIGEDEGKEDGLGFDTYANVLSQAALETKGPFTIGIFGEWGSGKTSLMRMIESKLVSEIKIKNKKKKEQVLTVWFNAWRYEKEEHPMIPLIATIIKEVRADANFLAKVKEEGGKWLKALYSLAYGFSIKGTIPALNMESGFAMKDVLDKNEELTHDPLLDKSLYYQAFERLKGKKLGANVKIVIIIDDLDRCFPSNAVQLLESIKLFLSQPNFIFVIGLAKTVIEEFLKHKYAAEYGIPNFNGEEYLEKIIQLPFRIPPHESRMEDFSKKLIAKMSQKDQDTFRIILPIIGIASRSNPRKTVRFVNNLLIDRAIFSATLDKKQTDLPIGFFAITRGMQMSSAWNRLMKKIYGENEICSFLKKMLEDFDHFNYQNDEDFKAFSSANQAIITDFYRLLASDKNLLRLLSSKEGKAWLGEHEKRQEAINFIFVQREALREDALSESPNIILVRMIDSASKNEATKIEEELNKEGVGTRIISIFSKLVDEKGIDTVANIGFIINKEAITYGKLDKNLSSKLLQSVELGLKTFIFYNNVKDITSIPPFDRLAYPNLSYINWKKMTPEKLQELGISLRQ